MTTHLTEHLRSEHAHLQDHVAHIRELAREIGELDLDARVARLAAVLDFLNGTLLPHAREEEAELYPEAARILGDARATAPMIHDHTVIVEHVRALEKADRSDAERLRELLYGLHALITAHFRKEEELYLPLLDGEEAR